MDDNKTRYLRLTANFDKLRSTTSKLFGRLMEDTDVNSIEARDWELIRELWACIEDTEKFYNDAVKQINYQTELLEEVYSLVKEIEKKGEKES